MSENNCPRAGELSPKNSARARAKVQKFIGNIFMFVYEQPASQCLAERINLSTHSTAMPSISNVCCFFLSSFRPPSPPLHLGKWSEFLMFVFLQNVYASERRSGEEQQKKLEEEIFFAIFYHNIKLIFLCATRKSGQKNVFMLNWNFLIFIFAGKWCWEIITVLAHTEDIMGLVGVVVKLFVKWSWSGNLCALAGKTSEVEGSELKRTKSAATVAQCFLCT